LVRQRCCLGFDRCCSCIVSEDVMAFMQEVLERIEDIVYILLYLIECIVLVHH
jgi:hypothetical protein